MSDLSLSSTALVSVAEASEYVFRTDQAAPAQESEDYDVLVRIINACTERIEAYCQRVFVARGLDETLDGTGHRWLELRETPVNSLTQIDRLDEYDGSAQETWSTSGDWRIDSRHGRIAFSDGRHFIHGQQNYRVQYNGGYSAANVPQDVVLAALQLIAKTWRDFDKSRDDIESVSVEGQSVSYNRDDMPKKVKHILAPWRRIEQVFA